jgi:hypothetical protein
VAVALDMDIRDVTERVENFLASHRTTPKGET